MTKVPLHGILEKMFGIGKMNTEKQVRDLVAELRKNPDEEIDFGKFAEKK